MNPVVSIICTTYNQKKYIKECIDGLLMQKTTFPYEIIIHDDASTDGTAEIVKDYQKNNPEKIKAVFQTENQYSQDINIVKTHIFPLIKGIYVARCEGDDYWTDSYKLQKQVNALENNRDCRFCVHLVEDVSEGGKPIGATCPKIKLKTGIISSKDFIAMTNQFFHLSSFLQYTEDLKKYYENTPNYAQISKVGDKPMQLFFGSIGNVFYIDEPMSCYRQDSVGSWTLTNFSKSDNHIYEIADNFLKVYKSFDLETNYRYHTELKDIIEFQEYKSNTYLYPYRKVFDKKNNKFFKKESTKNKVKLIFRCLFPDIIPKIELIRKNNRNNLKK